MKRKILSATSDADIGFSLFGFQNKYGCFYGTADCSPEDLETFSAYAGERYAEIRAMAQFAKLRLSQEKIKLNTIKNLLKDMEYDQKCNTESHNPYIHRIRIKLRDYSQSVEDWQNLYSHLRESVKIQDEQRQKILNRTKKENKQN